MQVDLERRHCSSVIDQLRQQAATLPLRVILPEQNDPRVLAAATSLTKQGLAVPVFLSAPQQELPGCEIFWDLPDAQQWFEKAVLALSSSQKNKGMSRGQARSSLDCPLLLSTVLLRIGYVDAGVAGSIASTADVLRACIRGIGLAPDSRLISSVFLMEFTDKVLTFGDCAVNPEPSPEQLAQIAADAASTHRALTHQPPKVALLSFSTKGSAEHDKIDKVREALAIAKSRQPELIVDGELQFDAAYVAEIGAIKAPNSPVAGQANVLIFPDLNTGNIAYKITERIGGANAIGPILQGLAKPWIDLSRGCSAEDIVNAAVIASVFARNSPTP